MSKSHAKNSSSIDGHGRTVSPEVAEELALLRSRIGAAVIARRVWERLLTKTERERLGGDLEACWREYGTAGMWVQAKGVPLELAIVQVAKATNLMTAATEKWLLRELGHERSVPQPDDRPVWKADTGELYFRGQPVRRVRVNRRPSNIQKILHAFQQAGWPSRVANPLGDDPDKLRQTLYSLNERLKVLRFSSQKGGRTVTWKIR